ncbi:MAG: aspartate/glutamate racemase family protein [Lawsonibacter sp.]
MNNRKSLGILMLDTKFPRIPGDVGNPETFPFPIQKLLVTGADPKRVVIEGDPALLEPFLQGAEELERLGVSAITTSCGFLAMFQKELAARVTIPVFASSLLQVNLVSNSLPADKCVGIMTADSRNLDHRHFSGVGIEHIKKVVYGMENTHFHDVFVGNSEHLDQELACRNMVDVSKRMVKENPDVGAIVFECTNMPPYASAVFQAVGLPVYDITTLAAYMMSGNERLPF